MKTIIGAEAARWAGLQIDLNQKYRAGHITADHLEWFNGLKRVERDRLSGITSPDMRFELVKMLDITVPDGYVHATQLTTFTEAHRGEFYYFNGEITDKNFSRATTQLKPGQKLKVGVFQIKETVTSEDCMRFLKSQKAILTGAQGASLVYEQKREELPKGKWHVSFDEKETLWQDAGGFHRVPNVRAYTDGDFCFCLGYFEGDWYGNGCLLSFRDAEPVSGE